MARRYAKQNYRKTSGSKKSYSRRRSSPSSRRTRRTAAAPQVLRVVIEQSGPTPATAPQHGPTVTPVIGKRSKF